MSDIANAIGPVAQDIISSSPELQDRIASLVELTIEALEEIMVDGTPSEQIALATKLAPYIFRKAETEQSVDDGHDAEEIRAMLLGMWEGRKGGGDDAEP